MYALQNRLFLLQKQNKQKPKENKKKRKETKQTRKKTENKKRTNKKQINNKQTKNHRNNYAVVRVHGARYFQSCDNSNQKS